MNARHCAISVLIEINQQGAYNNIALRQALDARPDWDPRDKGFVTEIVNGTLRNLILIDYILNKFSRNPTSHMKPFIRELLRTAVYQIRFMDRVPNSAAVNEAVKLARANGYSALSGFVNGILRNIVRSHEADFFELPNDWSIKYSFPPWLVDATKKWLGSKAEDFFAASHITPGVCLAVNKLKTNEYDEPLLHFKNQSDIRELDGFQKGHLFVMDEGAYLAAKAVNVKPGDSVIDLCAAPGGKSFALAIMMENKGQIIACDIHAHKIRLMENMARHLGISCITTEERDATVVNQKWQNWADAVILDAPCSGFGIIRRKPDIKYSKTMEDVLNMAELQRQLLTSAATYVKPGGTLVYSTCTIATEENSDNVQWFTDNFDFKLEESTQLMPTDRNDGFFIAKLRKDTNDKS